MNQKIAYEGTSFTIEWFIEEKGCSQALKYFLEQPPREATQNTQSFSTHG
jgi:hypothetical protein